MGHAMILITLLLSISIVETRKHLENQTEEGETFPFQFQSSVKGKDVVDKEKDTLVTCGLCKLVVFKLQNKVGSCKSKAKIMKMLDKFCDLLNVKPLKTPCKKFVTKHVNTLIDALVKALILCILVTCSVWAGPEE
ncbi:unnamed protein product [Menidia menidia]|uniref:(Atlantic silverside) hypothetical protein n=1 Tax=Menidia menidia TaxID=238744 RepID=A0A8S4ADI5_9TELE|nr:unnamed protein product [Menidia menidia]